ncbi:glycoside hydrolase family 6 protein [Streptomyces apocyni]|uniref:glycoside hydrolase family 6 protein n=1 Tax=Streptomyces apocyni TaxID=2654677 RepID=UPI0012E9F5F4|nr:glycoside hydrolase family 6 protein [Streptomyces apocyni]
MYGRDSRRKRRPARWGVRVGAGAVGAALLLTGCTSSDGSGDGKDKGKANSPVKQQPKDNDPYWVNPDSKAAGALAEYQRDGKDEDAALIKKIAEQPVGNWIRTDGEAERETREITEAAQKADRDALLVLYNIPHRDCGQYSGGGAANGKEYAAWIDQIAKGIGDRPATVILEPDAVLHLVDDCTPGEYHKERYEALKGAIKKLKSLANTKVYLDAGNAGWGSPDSLYEPLTWSGVAEADGFSVNVSNFYTTTESIEFGKKLSVKIGNKPFVIDTSRNGNGPYTEGDPSERWCNPPGRALGETPTTNTGDELVDAYLWVKRPGESDGECKGGPKAGEWWPEYAKDLVKASK